MQPTGRSTTDRAVSERCFALAARALRLVRPPEADAPGARAEQTRFLDEAALDVGRVLFPVFAEASRDVDARRLEEVQYRVKTLAALISLSKTEQAAEYLGLLDASVTYARAQTGPARTLWRDLGLAAQAVRLVAGALSQGPDAEAVRNFESEVKAARLEVLDALRQALLSQAKVPWQDVAAFLYGDENQLLSQALGPAIGPATGSGLGTDRLAAGAGATGSATAVPVVSVPLDLRVQGPQRIRAALERARARMQSRASDLYVAPEIPQKKLVNARRVCEVSDDEEIVGLLDCTLFGAATDCVLWSTTRIYYRNFAAPQTGPHEIRYSRLPALLVTRADALSVRMGEQPQCTVAGSSMNAEDLLQILRDLTAIARGEPLPE